MRQRLPVASVVTCRPVSGRRWWADARTVGVLVLAAVTFGFSGWTLVRDPPPVQAGSYTAPQPATHQVVSLWLGDSYTAGTGAADAAHGEACLTAKALRWKCELDAEGGTGFVADGHVNFDHFSPLGDRLDATIAKYEHADVVVIDAGRNDGAFPRSTVKAAVESYFERVHQAWPNARLFVVAPYFLGNPDRPGGSWLAATEKSLSRRYGATFIDPLADGWPTREGLTIADGVHPSPDGHAYIAEHLTDALK